VQAVIKNSLSIYIWHEKLLLTVVTYYSDFSSDKYQSNLIRPMLTNWQKPSGSEILSNNFILTWNHSFTWSQSFIVLLIGCFVMLLSCSNFMVITRILFYLVRHSGIVNHTAPQLPPSVGSSHYPMTIWMSWSDDAVQEQRIIIGFTDKTGVAKLQKKVSYLCFFTATTKDRLIFAAKASTLANYNLVI